ncbi:MAG: hypothetical protein EOO15_18470, partial [Chitinophagaceae bacterium]
MKQHRVSRLAVLCLTLTTTIVSCSKADYLDGSQPAPSETSTGSFVDGDAIATAMSTNALAATSVTTSTSSLPPFVLPYALSVNWNNRSNGDYTLAQATADMGPASYWQGTGAQSQAYTGTLRTTLLRNALATGGVQSKVDIPDATMYRLSFDMLFANDFDFSLGGKAGFGLLIGDGNSGTTSGTNGNGGSVRLAWAKNAAGNIVLKPNVYHKDQVAADGDDFGKQYPATGSIAKNTWYKVAMSVTSNSGTTKNGSLLVTINGVVVINEPMRWTTNDAKRFVSNFVLDATRGGT